MESLSLFYNLFRFNKTVIVYIILGSQRASAGGLRIKRSIQSGAYQEEMEGGGVAKLQRGEIRYENIWIQLNAAGKNFPGFLYF